MLCQQKRIGTQKIDLSCPSAGHMFMGKHYNNMMRIGIMSDQSKQFTACQEHKIFEEQPGIANCTKDMDIDKFKKRFLEQCHAKKSCSLDITGLYSGTIEHCGDNAFIYV